jgi:rod shape determining protein RodA
VTAIAKGEPHHWTSMGVDAQRGTRVVIGVPALFLFHIVINAGMVRGLLPIAGIPLPLVSAGGSSLISFFLAMGICMNIKMRRYVT